MKQIQNYEEKMKDKINWDDWEECTLEEYHKGNYGNRLKILFEEKYTYFKRKPKTVFETRDSSFSIKDEKLYIRDTRNTYQSLVVVTKEEMPIFLDAVDEWRRQFGSKK